MKHNYQPRLKIYHNILGKFDLIDKYNSFQSKYFRSLDIKVSWHFNELVKTNFNKLLFKEFFLQQRFKYKKTFKRTANTFFIITLRKINVFLYLEMLLNSSLLNTKYKVDSNFKKTASTLLTISQQNKFFNNHKNQFIKFQLKNLFEFNSSFNSGVILTNFNYYFLPVGIF